MAADLAWITYDRKRQYRSVISQQGRVTLEADNNEAATIASEALRLETIDIVGPTGTPDDGYKVGPGAGPGGVSIGPGIFYLGGWRLELDAAIDLSNWPGSLDAPTMTVSQGNLLVALLLTEQSVCAVEDQALREVALGGPDSAARMRLMQQFPRLPLDGDTCAAGAAAIAATLTAEGISIDPATLQLKSSASLQAGFVPGPPITDPCTPAAAGGYLGADNQLVRVTVIAYDPTARTGTLLWGWNNASLLYRAKMTDPLTLTLTGTPVDEEHAPQLGQAVEILRSRHDLGDGNFIAAPEGFVTTLTQAHSFDTGTLGLADALPADFQADTNPLFVRLWQATVPFNAGGATPLDSISGITVTLTLPALPTTIALRPFWRFAARPSTPVKIYPQRYQETPQPPDGPRQWLTDLAVVRAQESGSTLLANCRVPFKPLTQQSGTCCSLVLGPQDVDGRGGLQAVLDGLAGTRSSVALQEGTYTLSAPLVLGKKHSGLTLEGCVGSVRLVANAANLAPFRYGLVVLEAASDITLRNLSLTIPNVPLAASAPNTVPLNQGTTNALAANAATTGAAPTRRAATRRTATAAAATGAAATRRAATRRAATAAAATGALDINIANTALSDAAVQPATSIGILAVASPGLTVESCNFNANPGSVYVFGAGLFALGDSTGLTVRRNKFVTASYQAGGSVSGIVATVLNANVTTALDSAEISDNLFQNLAAGLVTFTQLGLVRCSGNRVVQCGTGLFFATSNLGATTELVRQAVADTTQSAALSPAVTSGMQPSMLATMLTQSEPFAARVPAPPSRVVSAAARNVLLRDVITRGTAAWRSIVTRSGAAPPVTSPAPAPPAGPPQTPPATPNETLTNALNLVRDVSIAAELADVGLTPVLHIESNDVRLIGTGTTPGVGIAIVLSPREGAFGMVLRTANRVVTADTKTEAAAILFPNIAAVTGNVFLQTGAANQPAIPAFMLLAEAIAKIEVTANVIHSTTAIVPARANPAATTNWDFLNSTG